MGGLEAVGYEREAARRRRVSVPGGPKLAHRTSLPEDEVRGSGTGVEGAAWP